ncbi:unnamed protein product [Protopolystoma xenopodis]|uniref:Uncharacterized protein n=1 Tax=Protopolystoma xenopodis TaxID=117903 RepID=A0A448XBQ0_9PLAT|nr:unnamed protein product [Protopolystoma xenopodis]
MTESSTSQANPTGMIRRGYEEMCGKRAYVSKEQKLWAFLFSFSPSNAQDLLSSRSHTGTETQWPTDQMAPHVLRRQTGQRRVKTAFMGTQAQLTKCSHCLHYWSLVRSMFSS